MPVFLAKAAFTSSSAFFSEAAAKTVIVCSCAADGTLAMAIAMRQATTRCSILRSSAAAARERADALRQNSLSGKGQPGSAVPGRKARLRRAVGHGTRLAASQLDAKAVSIYPFVPAKAGTQPLALDSRLRGNERKRFVR